MSYLSEELLRQLSEKKIAAGTLADRTQISPSQISKWTRGEQTSISEAQLSVIQAALSDDPADHVALVVAHLLDEKFGLNHELVEIITRLEAALQERPRPRSLGERALHFLALERVRNPDLNEMLISQARLLGGFLKEEVSPATVPIATQTKIAHALVSAVQPLPTPSLPAKGKVSYGAARRSKKTKQP